MKDEITIGELVTQMYEAAHKMSAKNSHRALMLRAMSAIIQLSKLPMPKEQPLVELVRQ